MHDDEPLRRGPAAGPLRRRRPARPWWAWQGVWAGQDGGLESGGEQVRRQRGVRGTDRPWECLVV
jgi:hypothetical protein